MKILLLTDVKNVGRRGEIKDLPDGYAQNFIIPRKLGEVATKQKIEQINQVKQKIEGDKELRKELLLRELHEVNDKEVLLVRKVNASGSLFAAISVRDICDAVKEQTHIHIPLEYIQIDQIKHTGEHTIKVGDKKKLGKEFSFKLIIKGQ